MIGSVGLTNVQELNQISESGGLAIVAIARKSFLGETGAAIIALSALAAALSSIVAVFLVSTRMLYALARDAHFPRILGSIDAHRLVPRRAIFISSLLSILFCFFASAETLAAISDYGFIFGIGMINYMVIVLRKKYPDTPRPFKVPFYPWTVYLAVVLNLIFIPVLIILDPLAVQVGVACTVIGIFVYFLVRRSITIDRKIKKFEKMVHRAIKFRRKSRKRGI